MANTVSNLLKINGTVDQVSNVRNYIKGTNGESISFEKFIPVPEDLDMNSSVEVCGISIPSQFNWRLESWGTTQEAMPIEDVPDTILFATVSATPYAAMQTLSAKFPEVTLHITFSDDIVEQYCGEYTLVGGNLVDGVFYEEGDDIPIDQVMEYYFLTHDYDRESWYKNEDGEWVCIDYEVYNED